MPTTSTRVSRFPLPRAIGQRIVEAWRSSVRFRTSAITLGLSALALLISFLVMSYAIQDNLYQSRVTQALTDARKATQSAQRTLDAAEIDGNAGKMNEVISNVRSQIDLISGATASAGLRDPASPPSAVAAPGWTTQTTAEIRLDTAELTPALRSQVREKPDSSWYQPIALRHDGERVPAIVVGQTVNVPEAGPYELYFAYDLSTQQRTLSFVQGTLWLAGLVLLVIIGVIIWSVLRVVTAPIAETARTSASFAAGNFGARIRVEGIDEVATLGRSFNSMADSIEAQIAELGELSLVQQRFVSDVSHELRTPLTTIRLAAVMLNDRREEFDDVAGRAVELLNEQVERFDVLLNDLLEISRYDAGSVQLELEPTALAALAEDVIAQMQPLAEQHGTDLRLVAPGGYSPTDMDPRRIRRIVRNLVGNAIEHGEGRPIVVTVDSDSDTVALGVRDYGLGMKPEDMERVFDRFWRADPSRKRTIGGTGLGLAIALGDAKLHQGELQVWSKLNAGSNFVLVLPRTMEDGARTLESPVPVHPLPGPNTLPLDDLGHTQPIVLPKREEEQS